MMPNVDNINKLIARLQADDGSHFCMTDWVRLLPHGLAKLRQDPHYEYASASNPPEYVECGTAFCLAGWANTLRLDEEKVNWKAIKGYPYRYQFSDYIEAGHWLGLLSREKMEALFYMGAMADVYAGHERDKFDGLPQPVRKAAGIAVLEHLRDTGEVNWPGAIAKARSEHG
jgi:hypothetical protein